MNAVQQTGACRCGTAAFSISGRPLLRACCHCRICQQFNQADYADITVYYRSQVALEDERAVAFRAYKQPPLVQRGTCVSCGKPAIEWLRIPPLPGMAIVPSYNIADQALVPAPAFHIFYHRRNADVADGLPKYSGFLNSQCRFSLALISAMLRGGRA